MLFFIDRQDVPGTVGEGPRRRHIGEQHEAAGLFLSTTDAFDVRSESRLPSRAHGYDWARCVGTGPAPAIHGLALHSDVHQMVGGRRGLASCVSSVARSSDDFPDR